MQSAINSGAIELHKESINEIVDYTLAMFNRFLQSNAELRLEDSFKIYFKVLSLDHVTYPHHRRGPTAVLGCKKEQTIPGTLDCALGYDKTPNAFVNLCLLTSVILGHHKIIATKTNHFAKFNLLLKLCDGFKKKSYSKNNPKRRRVKMDVVSKFTEKKAGTLMKNEIDNIFQNLDIPKIGPYDAFETCPLLSNFFKC